MSRIEPIADGPLTKHSDTNPLKAEKDSEYYCQQCGARITRTTSVGEAGHQPDCPRRETHYHGKTGDTGFGNGRLNQEGSA